MVTASQLQLLQSPITALLSSISTSVNVKLDDSNYLNWHFQMQLLLESNGNMGFVDGSHPCPAPHSSSSDESGINSSSQTDDYKIWKLHDRAIMQVITATLSSVAMSCAIGSTSSKDLWIRLKEQFSTVSRTSIFQMKSNLQTIKKGSDSISQYLHRIKEARDYLAAAGVYFADEDIVILALNGLPAEYNTFRCVIRGRESVISLKDFRSQLLAEETIVDNPLPTPLLTAMVANTGSTSTKGASFQSPGFSSSHGPSQMTAGGFRHNYGNKNKGKGRFSHGSRFYPARPVFSPTGHGSPSSTSGVLGHSPGPQSASPFAPVSPICQLCNSEGHTAPFCALSSHERPTCHICGRNNHTTWNCFFNHKGPNYIGLHNLQFPSPQSSYSMQPQHVQFTSYPASSQQSSFSPAQSPGQQPPMQAMHTMLNSASQSSSSSCPPQVWLTDSGATNHMTADLSSFSMASPYPTTESIHTANGESLQVSHVGKSTLHTSVSPITLNSVLCVPQLTHNLLSVHRLCLDNNCWVLLMASTWPLDWGWAGEEKHRWILRLE